MKWQMAIDWDKASVAVVNPFCTKRGDSKNIIVLFSDETYEDVFPAEMKEDLRIVCEIIPWTKYIGERLILRDGTEVDPRSYILKYKDDLIIKRANTYSSAAVFLGDDVEYWEDNQIKTARCIYDGSPYIHDGKLGGLLNRASTDKLTSFESGKIATIMPRFEKMD